ncbi:hypothetical protein [Oceanobacillus oncorhynchi]|nr:hypothetical protein [Oceanobacillus oncorhynchi]
MNFDEKLAFYWLENRMPVSFVGEVNLFGSLFVYLSREFISKASISIYNTNHAVSIPDYSSLDILTHHAMIFFKERHEIVHCKGGFINW